MEVALLQVGEKAVCGLSAAAVRGRVSVRRAFADALPRAFDSIPAADRGKVLLEVLKRNSFDERRLTLVVPRRFAILRQFSVPAGPPEEVASMVRFQLEKELPVPVDGTRYIHHELETRGGKIDIVAACVPRDYLDPLMAALEEIGIKVASVVLGTMGLAHLAPRADGAVAMECAFEDSAELLIWSPARILVSQSGSVQGLDAAGRAAQLARMLSSFLERGEPVSRLILTRELPELGERLGGSLPCEMVDLKPLLRGDDRLPPSEALPLIGAAAGLGSRSPWIKNFLAPPVAKKRSRSITLARAAGLVAVILIGLVVYLRFEQADLEAQIDEKQAILKQHRDVPKRLKELKAREGEALQWAENRPRWIDVMADLSDLIDTKKLFLTNADFDTQGGSTLVGRAKRKQDASDLVQSLNGSKRFGSAILVIAQESREDPKQRGEAADYPVNFTIKAKVGAGSQIR
jgi:Tfp pilus assembly protein PilN